MGFTKFVLLGAVGAMLSACGSSSTSVITPPKPLPAAPLLSFENLAKNANTGSLASAANATTEVVVISEGVDGDGNIEVAVGSTVYQLAGSQSAGSAAFNVSQAGTTVDVKEISKQSEALLAFTQVGDGSASDLSGYSVLGNRTPQLEIAVLKSAVISSATYNGTSHLVATHEDGFKDTASGDLVLDVDFGSSIFSGTMDLTSSTATGIMNFDIGTVNAMISNGVISATGDLTADVDVAAGDPAAFPNNANQLGLDTLVTGTMTGAIYGPNGQEAGGEFSFSGSEPPKTFIPGEVLKKIVVQGGFLGKQ